MSTPLTVARYRDPVEGFAGYLVVDGHRHRLAAGGLRVMRGVDVAMLSALARQMTLKQRLLGLAVDGAKAGIDYDPSRTDKSAALARFMAFLRPYLGGRVALGPDSGTTWSQIETAARAEGVGSTKLAIARAQRLSLPDFFHRLAQLDAPLGRLSLGERRAGHGLASAALAALQWVAAPAPPSPRVALQGFGTLGRAAAVSLAQAGAELVAVADAHRTVLGPTGAVDLDALLAAPVGSALPVPPRHQAKGSDAVFDVPADVHILAACADALSGEAAEKLETAVVVVGANLGLSPGAESILGRRGIWVVPDLVGGCGGSASMNELFGPSQCPSPGRVLERTGEAVACLVYQMLDMATQRHLGPRQAALEICKARAQPVARRPYRSRCDRGARASAGSARANVPT